MRIAWPEWLRDRFAGAPLKRIALACAGQAVRGEAMITRGGLEGGAVYALGRTIRATVEAGGIAPVTLDLRPDLDAADLVRRLGGPAVSRANALRRAGLSPAAAALVQASHAQSAGQTPLAALVKQLPLTVTGMEGLERAISTAGGVGWAGLEGLMLRARPGTFLAGEMLDWEAPTGGYLLQGCFATADAASRQALAWIARGTRPHGRPTS